MTDVRWQLEVMMILMSHTGSVQEGMCAATDDLKPGTNCLSALQKDRPAGSMGGLCLAVVAAIQLYWQYSSTVHRHSAAQCPPPPTHTHTCSHDCHTPSQDSANSQIGSDCISDKQSRLHQ